MRRPSWRGWLRAIAFVVFAIVAIAMLAAGGGWFVLRASLPTLDGTLRLDGPRAALRLERDARGRTSVFADSRADLAFGLGFAHSQDRFFQMDLLRRAGAGELAALVGPLARRLDVQARTHGLHAVADAALARAPDDHRHVLDAYTRGVNAGLEDLDARPWEYFALRQRPEPWRPVDSFHVLMAMTRDLQPTRDRYELSREFAPRFLRDQVFAALFDPASEWDAPLDGEVRPVPRVEIPADGPGRPDVQDGATGAAPRDRDDDRGSNAFAVAGGLTRDGRAILANDMHLGLALPTIWYAVRMQTSAGLDLSGVTLPGTPAMVVGTNGAVAWGFTNSYGDWVDHLQLEVHPDDPDRYRGPDGWTAFGERREVIEIAGAAPETTIVRTTAWGPVTVDVLDASFATRWVAHDSEASNLRLLDLERARSVEAVLELAPRCGIPHQNILVADAEGRIGWTIAGRVPRRVGTDGTRPIRIGDARWDGWRDPDQVPRRSAEGDARMWTANARVAPFAEQAVIGDAGYAIGARATVIRDALFALETADEGDLFAIQNRTRSPLMQRWYERLVRIVGGAERGDVRPLLDDWTGSASVHSVAYRLVRDWRREVHDVVYGGLLAPVWEATDGRWIEGPRREPIVWSMLTSSPDWVPGGHADWSTMESAALDSVLAAWGDSTTWSRRTWGARNTTRIEHPLAAVFPDFVARHLRLPPRPVAGDAYTARVGSPTFGASERLVVAPGAEDRGILQLPGGNAAHPLSPYRTGDYEDWVEGRPTPLLPGPPRHVLRLEPRT